jgi:DNA-binding HxlR family transcriptional regulator
MATNCSTHGRQYATDTATQGTLIEMAEIIGHKWYPVILHELCVEDDRGFSDLRDAIDRISNKMLSDSLSALEDRGLVDRAVVSDKPVRVRYTLTDAGHDLEAVLAAMLDWGQSNLDRPVDQRSAPPAATRPEPVAATAHSGGHSTGGDR